MDNGRIVEGGACDQIVFDIKEMMSYLNTIEVRHGMNNGLVSRHTRHWRIKTALKVCDNCPMSAWMKCLSDNPTTPGVRAGQYLSLTQSKVKSRVNIYEVQVEDQAV